MNYYNNLNQNYNEIFTFDISLICTSFEWEISLACVSKAMSQNSHFRFFSRPIFAMVERKGVFMLIIWIKFSVRKFIVLFLKYLNMFFYWNILAKLTFSQARFLMILQVWFARDEFEAAKKIININDVTYIGLKGLLASSLLSFLSYFDGRLIVVLPCESGIWNWPW